MPTNHRQIPIREKILGLYYNDFQTDAPCPDSQIPARAIENSLFSSPVEKVGLAVLRLESVSATRSWPKMACDGRPEKRRTKVRQKKRGRLLRRSRIVSVICPPQRMTLRRSACDRAGYLRRSGQLVALGFRLLTRLAHIHKRRIDHVFEMSCVVFFDHLDAGAAILGDLIDISAFEQP